MMKSFTVQQTVQLLIIGLIAIVIIVAILPSILTQISKLSGVISGTCEVISKTDTTDGWPPVGAEWQVGQPWFDGRWFLGLPNDAVTGGKCEATNIGTPIPSPSGIVYYYIPTSTSNSPYATIITTLIQLMPVMLVLGLIIFALAKFGVLGNLRKSGGSKSDNDAN